MQPIVIYPDRKRMLVRIFGAVVFLLLDVWVLFTHAATLTIIQTLAAVLGLVVLVIAGSFIITRLLWRKPAVIIDERGLTDYATAVSVGFIPWSDVVSAKIYIITIKSSKQKVIGVSIRNQDLYLTEMSFLKRSWLKLNGRMYGYMVNIPQVLLKVDLEEILSHINFYIRRTASPSSLSWAPVITRKEFGKKQSSAGQ